MPLLKLAYHRFMRTWQGEITLYISIAYLVFCLLQFVFPHFTASIDHVDILKADGQIVKSVDIKDLRLKRGDDIKVTFNVQRFYYGKSQVERVLRFEHTELLLETLDRNFVPTDRTKDVKSIVVFHIPKFLEPRCGYNVFSRSSFQFDYNILSILIAKQSETKPLTFCIDP